MKCSDAKELLSAFYDDELPSDLRAAVADHLEVCGDCARELAGFRSLSTMAERLNQPRAEAGLWQHIERELKDRRESGRTAVTQPVRTSPFTPVLALWRWVERVGRPPGRRMALWTAATVLIAIGWIGYAIWFDHGREQAMAAVFDEYLAEFPHDADAAQQVLLRHYDGRPLDNMEQAVQSVGYRPLVANGVPPGYTIRRTYVMKMPCCTCVQCLCRRGDGTTIAVFEHDDKEPGWFGDRQAVETECNGTRCRLVHVDGKMAATWQRGGRHLTVVGVKDQRELEQWVAWFENRTRPPPEARLE